MKKAEILNELQKGQPLLVGSYWGGRLETIEVRDSKNLNGPKRKSHKIIHTVMTEKDPIVLTSWLPDNQKPEDFKPAADKGQQVVIRIRSMVTPKGTFTTSFAGEVEALV